MPCGLRACDIRDAQCQQDIAASTACLRDVPAVMVPVTVINRDDYVRDAMATPWTPEQEQAFRTWTDGLALFGLAPKGQSTADYAGVQAAWVGAFYSHDSKSITVLDHGYPLDSIYAVALLAHECQHAIQDARYGIEATFDSHGTTFDSAQAISAVIEGEASVVGDRALIHLFGDSPSEISWPSIFRKWQARQRTRALTSTDPVTLAYPTFSYAFGTSFLHQAITAGGWPAADGVFAAPPSGAREVMAGFQAVQPAAGTWAEDLGDAAVPVLDSRFTFQRAERMGAWVAAMLLGRAPVYLDDDPERRITGDELSFFRDQVTDTVVAAWRLRFATTTAAEAIATTILGVLERGGAGWEAVRVQVVDRDIILLAAASATILNDLPWDPAFRAVPPATAALSTAADAHGRAADIRCALPELPPD